MGQMVRGAEVDYQLGDEKPPSKQLWERRHSFRVQVPAHASVLHKGKLCGYYLVEDVSIGGCSLRGSPLLPQGEHLDVLLHLPHRAPLALSARVQRSDAELATSEQNGARGNGTPARSATAHAASGHMGLRFEHTPPKAEDCLQDFVV
ncbi:MAG TPA: PilZ domain-containing protein, partial [Polyangiales bacterium]|nr:PilZ domain-containing protein [Polyangiales bacterium]